jgi:hypothetical protein
VARWFRLLHAQAYSTLVHACAASRLPTLALSVSLCSMSFDVDTFLRACIHIGLDFTTGSGTAVIAVNELG